MIIRENSKILKMLKLVLMNSETPLTPLLGGSFFEP